MLLRLFHKVNQTSHSFPWKFNFLSIASYSNFKDARFILMSKDSWSNKTLYHILFCINLISFKSISLYLWVLQREQKLYPSFLLHSTYLNNSSFWLFYYRFSQQVLFFHPYFFEVLRISFVEWYNNSTMMRSLFAALLISFILLIFLVFSSNLSWQFHSWMSSQAGSSFHPFVYCWDSSHSSSINWMTSLFNLFT